MAYDLPTYDICIQEGTDYTLVLSLLDDNDEPLDLTGALDIELNIRFLNVTKTYPGTVNGNSITYHIEETEVYSALNGTYQADYTLGTETSRVLRGSVLVERAL